METDKHLIIQDRIRNLGVKLEFLSYSEVGTGQERSSWIDVVWFDKRIKGEFFKDIVPLDQDSRIRKEGKPSLDTDFVLPLIGFEIEDVSDYKSKHIKGSAANLDSLGCLVGVIVIYNNGEDKQKLLEQRRNVLRYMTDMKTRTRIVVLTELRSYSYRK